MMSRSITYEEAKNRVEEKRESAEAYLRAMIEGRSKNNSNDDNLEKVVMLLNKASLTFKEAMNSDSSKRRELLEEALRAYVDIVPYLVKMPYLTVPVLQQIKNIEKTIEMEIEKSVNVKANTSIDIDSIIKKTGESFL